MKSIYGFFIATVFILTLWDASYSQVVAPDSAASAKRNNANRDTTLLKKVPHDTIKNPESTNRSNIQNTKIPENDTVIPPKNKPRYEIKAGKKVPLRDSIQ